jgi:hypothetical protein
MPRLSEIRSPMIRPPILHQLRVFGFLLPWILNGYADLRPLHWRDLNIPNPLPPFLGFVIYAKISWKYANIAQGNIAHKFQEVML